VRVSLSEQILPHDTRAIVGDNSPEVDIGIDNPDVLWLRNPSELEELQKVFRRVLKNIRRKVPHCARIHLFYAGPAPGAVAIGQSINPTMNPTVVTYNYTRNRSPRYEQSITLDKL